MDYYDSTYPLDYYSIGQMYLFHRDTENRSYWQPQNPEGQRIYEQHIAKYMKLFKTSKSKAATDAEGALINWPGINREIGIVVGKYDDGQIKLLTVLFDDGKVSGYIVGKSVAFNQKNYPACSPKLKVTIPQLERLEDTDDGKSKIICIPASILALAGEDAAAVPKEKA